VLPSSSPAGLIVFGACQPAWSLNATSTFMLEAPEGNLKVAWRHPNTHEVHWMLELRKSGQYAEAEDGE